MLKYKIKVDDHQVRLKLNDLYRTTPKLSRILMGRLGEAVVSRTVKHKLSGQVLKRKTGTLANSINVRLLNDWTAIVGTNVKYAAIHEFGGTILPKNKKMLSWKLPDGKWAFAKKVVMPARPFLGPAMNEVFYSGEAQRVMDNTTQSYLDKEWEI